MLRSDFHPRKITFYCYGSSKYKFFKTKFDYFTFINYFLWYIQKFFSLRISSSEKVKATHITTQKNLLDKIVELQNNILNMIFG